MMNTQGGREEIEEIRKILTKKNKPWSSRAIPKLYNWKSSIPDTWFRFCGPKRFKKSGALKVSGHLLNNSREFLHTLTTLKLTSLEEEARKEIKRKENKIKLSQISKGIDLIGQNKYIAERFKRVKARSQNSTPLKRKVGMCDI